ncbi:hypothetical protein DFH28DRAFT_1117991 [Melampsora americana]|nr:hypothetical protein DFH28DRAFT_1117991 [Melampsora americana]
MSDSSNHHHHHHHHHQQDHHHHHHHPTLTTIRSSSKIEENHHQNTRNQTNLELHPNHSNPTTRNAIILSNNHHSHSHHRSHHPSSVTTNDIIPSTKTAYQPNPTSPLPYSSQPRSLSRSGITSNPLNSIQPQPHRLQPHPSSQTPSAHLNPTESTSITSHSNYPPQSHPSRSSLNPRHHFIQSPSFQPSDLPQFDSNHNQTHSQLHQHHPPIAGSSSHLPRLHHPEPRRVPPNPSELHLQTSPVQSQNQIYPPPSSNQLYRHHPDLNTSRSPSLLNSQISESVRPHSHHSSRASKDVTPYNLSSQAHYSYDELTPSESFTRRPQQLTGISSSAPHQRHRTPRSSHAQFEQDLSPIQQKSSLPSQEYAQYPQSHSHSQTQENKRTRYIQEQERISPRESRTDALRHQSRSQPHSSSRQQFSPSQSIHSASAYDPSSQRSSTQRQQLQMHYQHQQDSFRLQSEQSHQSHPSRSDSESQSHSRPTHMMQQSELPSPENHRQFEAAQKHAEIIRRQGELQQTYEAQQHRLNPAPAYAPQEPASFTDPGRRHSSYNQINHYQPPARPIPKPYDRTRPSSSQPSRIITQDLTHSQAEFSPHSVSSQPQYHQFGTTSPYHSRPPSSSHGFRQDQRSPLASPQLNHISRQPPPPHSPLDSFQQPTPVDVRHTLSPVYSPEPETQHPASQPLRPSPPLSLPTIDVKPSLPGHVQNSSSEFTSGDHLTASHQRLCPPDLHRTEKSNLDPDPSVPRPSSGTRKLEDDDRTENSASPEQQSSTESFDDGVIRCICSVTTDDGFTIQCETCEVWQHAVCVGIPLEEVPEHYFCDQCEPSLDRRKELARRAHRAERLQRERITREASNRSQGSQAAANDDNTISEGYHRTTVLENATVVASPMISAVMSRAPSSASVTDPRAELATSINSHSTSAKSRSKDLQHLNTIEKTTQSNSRKTNKPNSTIPLGSAHIISKPAPVASGNETNHNTLGLCGLIEPNASKNTMLAPREIPTRKPGRRPTKTNPSKPQVAKATLEPISISNANSLGTGVDYDNTLLSCPVPNQTDLDERYEAWRYEFTPTAKDRYLDADVKDLISQLVAQHMPSHHTPLYDANLEPEGSDHFVTSEDTASPEINRTGLSLVGKSAIVSEPYPPDSNAPPTASNTAPKSAEPNHKGSRTNNHAFDKSYFMPVTMLELPSPLKLNVKIITLASTNFAPTFATNPFYPTFAATAATTSTSALPRLITHGVFSTHPITRGTFIGYLKGSITTLKKYTSDLCNQYSNIGCNKPYVKFFKSTRVDSMTVTPNDGLVIDSRQYGNENRFIRSGCHPNAFINIILTPHPSVSEENRSYSNTPTIQSPSQYSDHINKVEMTDGRDLIPEILDHDLHLPWEVSFGVFAAADISRREEIVLPWDWDDHHTIHLLPRLLNHSNTFESQLQSLPQRSPISTASQFLPWSSSDLRLLSSKMASIALTLFGLTICGCEKKRSCALNLMWKIGCLSAGLPLFPIRSEVEEEERSSTLLSMSNLKEKSEPYTFEEKLRIVLNSFLEQPNQNGVTNKSGRLLQAYPSFTNYNFNVTHPNRIKKHKIDLGPLLGVKRDWWNLQPSIQQKCLGIELAVNEKGNKRARSGSENSIPANSKLRRVSDTISEQRWIGDDNGSSNDQALEPEDEVVSSNIIRSQEMIAGSPPPALPPESKRDLDEEQATSLSPIPQLAPPPVPPSPQEDQSQLRVEDDRLQSTEISSNQPVKQEIVDEDEDMVLAEEEPIESIVDKDGDPDSVDTDGMKVTNPVTESLDHVSANGDLIVDQEVPVTENVEGCDIIMDETSRTDTPLSNQDLGSTATIDPSPMTQPPSPSMVVDDEERNLRAEVKDPSCESPQVGEQNGQAYSSEVKAEEDEDVTFEEASSEIEACLASDASTVVLGSSDEDLLSLSKAKRPKTPKVIANKPSPTSRVVVEPKIINPPVKRRKGRVILSSASSSSATEDKKTKTDTNTHSNAALTPSSSISNQSGDDDDDDDDELHVNIGSRAPESNSASKPLDVIAGSSGKINDALGHEDMSMSGVESDALTPADLAGSNIPIVDQPQVVPKSETTTVTSAGSQLTSRPPSAPEPEPEQVPLPLPLPLPLPAENSEPVQEPAPQQEPEEPKLEEAFVPKPPPPKRISLKDYRSRRVQEPLNNNPRTVTSPILRFSKPNELDASRRKLSHPPPPPLSSLPPLLPPHPSNQPLLPLSPRKLELVASVLKKDDKMREEEKIEDHKEEKTLSMDPIVSITSKETPLREVSVPDKVEETSLREFIVPEKVEETPLREVIVPDKVEETSLREMIENPLEARELADDDRTCQLQSEEGKRVDSITIENLSKAAAEVTNDTALLEDDLDGSTIENMSIAGSYEEGEEGEYRELEAMQDRLSLSNEAVVIHHAQCEEANHMNTEQYEAIAEGGSTSNEPNRVSVDQPTLSGRPLESPEQYSIPLEPIQDPVVTVEPQQEVPTPAEARRPRLSLAAYRLRLAESRPSSSETQSITDQQHSQAINIDPESPSHVRTQQTSPVRELQKVSESKDDQSHEMMTDEQETMDIDQEHHIDHDAEKVSLPVPPPADVLGSVSDETQLKDNAPVLGESAESKVEQPRKNSMYFPPFSPSLLMGSAGLSQSLAPPSSPQPGEIDETKVVGTKAVVSSSPFQRSRSRTPPEPYPASPSAKASAQRDIPTNHLNAQNPPTQSRRSSLPSILSNTTATATKVKEEEDTASEGEIHPRKQNIRTAETESPKGFKRVLSPITSTFPHPPGPRNGDSVNPKTTNHHQWPVSKQLHRTNMPHTSPYSTHRFELYRSGSRSPAHNHLSHFNSRSIRNRDGHAHPLRSRSPTKSPHFSNSASPPPTRHLDLAPSTDRDISIRASSSSWLSAPPRGPRALQASSSTINTTTNMTTATTATATHTNPTTHRSNWPPRRSSVEPLTSRPDIVPPRPNAPLPFPPRITSSSGRGSIVGSTTSGPGPPHLPSVPIGPRSGGIRNERARYEGPSLSPSSHRLPRAPASMSSSSIPATYGGSVGGRGRAKIRGSAHQYWGNNHGGSSSSSGGRGGGSSSSRNER